MKRTHTLKILVLGLLLITSIVIYKYAIAVYESSGPSAFRRAFSANLFGVDQDVDNNSWVRQYLDIDNALHYANLPKLTLLKESTVKCDAACEEFRSLLSNDWPKGKPKAAIVILTKNGREGMLIDTLKTIDYTFNNKYQYPVILFHEGNLDSHSEFKKNLKTIQSQVFLQKVLFRVPSFITRLEFRMCWAEYTTHHIGYRHMCRFHSRTIFEEPIMFDLEYYLRLDDDSRLASNISYDFFRSMRDSDMLHGYVRIMGGDAEQCSYGLWEATKIYIKQQNIQPEFFFELNKNAHFFNNFEVSSTAMWYSEEYRRFIEYIDRLEGFYFYRWGDALVKTIAVSMFIPRNKTLWLNDIMYCHRYLPNSCFMAGGKTKGQPLNL